MDDKVTALKQAAVDNSEAITVRLSAAMDKVGEWIEATGQFAVEQSPLLIQEIIYYEVASHALILFIATLAMGWGIFSYRWSYRNATARVDRMREHQEALRKEKVDRGERSYGTDETVFSVAHYGVPISGAVLGVVGFVVFLCNINGLVKPLVAPRLFLIEFFRHLAR